MRAVLVFFASVGIVSTIYLTVAWFGMMWVDRQVHKEWEKRVLSKEQLLQNRKAGKKRLEV